MAKKNVKEDKTHFNSPNSKRLTDQEKDEALFLYHLYGGNASEVARQLKTTTKTVRNLAVKQNFEGKKSLVQQRLNEVVFKSSDPHIAQLVEADVKALDIAERMLDGAHKAIKRKAIQPKSIGDVIAIMKYNVELRDRLLGNAKLDEDGKISRMAQTINVENMNILSLTPEMREKAVKALQLAAK